MSEVFPENPKISPAVRARFLGFVATRTHEVPSRIEGERQYEGTDLVDSTGQLIPVSNVRYEAFAAAGPGHNSTLGDASVSFWASPTPRDLDEGLDGVEVYRVNVGDDGEGYYSAGDSDEIARPADDGIVKDITDRLERLAQLGLLTAVEPPLS